MTAFSAVPLDRLAAPQIIDQPDFETIFQARKDRLIELAPHLAPALELESEGLSILLQEDSFREVLLRQAVQDAGRGNLLAFAAGPILDHLAAFYGVSRAVLTPGDETARPPVAAVLEGDDRLRRRVQLAPEGFTTAGSRGSYTFWALAADAGIKDVDVSETETPGEVVVHVLASIDEGTADQQLLDLVYSKLEPRRPLTDRVIVRSAIVQPYRVEAQLVMLAGPDAEVVRARAEARLADYVAAKHRLGHDVTISGIHAALHIDGVQNVALQEPLADLIIPPGTAAYCHEIDVTSGGVDV